MPSYRYKQIHTRPELKGNITIGKKHPTIKDYQREMAIKYGKVHGFAGSVGGWIVRSAGTDKEEFICHGWAWFFTLYQERIVKWAKEDSLYQSQFAQEDLILELEEEMRHLLICEKDSLRKIRATEAELKSMQLNLEECRNTQQQLKESILRNEALLK